MSLYCPESPADLCRTLQLDANPDQFALMERLATARGVVDECLRASTKDLKVGNTRGDVLRAALMVVLWRVLTVRGSRATVLAPSVEGKLACGELGRLAMAFLNEVCQVANPSLASVTRFPEWNRVEFAGEPGWEIRLVPNVPVIAAEAARRSLTGLVLDAGSTQPALVEAQRELEAIGRDSRGLLIRLW